MSPHAHHYVPPPQRPTRRQMRTGNALFVVCALLVGLALALTVSMPPLMIVGVDATGPQPVATPHAVTTTLPAIETSQPLQLRVADWRAGYAAALDNGCAQSTRLSSPLGLHP